MSNPTLLSDHCGCTWSRCDEFLGFAVAAEILVEEVILELRSEGAIVGDATHSLCGRNLPMRRNLSQSLDTGVLVGRVGV